MNNFIGFHATRSQGNPITIATSDGTTISKPPYISTLLERYGNTQNVVYDLDQFASVLLHGIGITQEQAQQLAKDEKIRIDDFKIVYFPKSYFVIEIGQYQFRVHNMNQDGYLKPFYTEDNSIEDTIIKAKEARDTANRVSKAFEYLILNTDNISSPIKAFLAKNQLDWPTVNDCPKEASRIAWNGIKGHWFETLKLGNFENAYSYDINGSYCFELSKLPDIRRGEWIQSTELSPTINEKAVLGIATGELTTESTFHPFLSRIGINNYTPTGTMPNILGLEAIRLLNKWKLGSFKISDGWFWIPTESIYNIYKGTMNYLWNKKREANNSTEKALCTRIYSALWGSQHQYLADKKVFGERFNSLISFLVEENSRIHVATVCLEQGCLPISIVGDGFITEYELPLELSKKLGGWKLSKQGACIVSGSGCIAFKSNEPPKGLALHYDTIIKQIKEKPKSTTYTRWKYSPILLAGALQQNFSKLGLIQKVKRSLCVGYSFERQFIERPKTGNDLLENIYDSIPWNFSVLNTKNLVDIVRD